jgi:hypothetical protein
MRQAAGQSTAVLTVNGTIGRRWFATGAIAQGSEIMFFPAEKHTFRGFLKKALPLLSCAVILIAGLGAAADDHLTYEKDCVLCHLSLFTPAVETCELHVPAPDIVCLFEHPDNVSLSLDLLAAEKASRGPPLSF